jgi:transposase InsO family protein
MVASSHPPLTDVMTERPYELLHMDLVGPARVQSASGKWYVLVVVDGYYRYAWVFFLEEKGETFGFVRDLVLRLRNERHGDAIRAIHSDNGSEFKNSHFESFCHFWGLEHQFSNPYTPPQNGVVERKNRTLCEMARTTLDEHRTPRRFWAEAVNTACYELMHGRTPKVSHFHVFGC